MAIRAERVLPSNFAVLQNTNIRSSYSFRKNDSKTKTLTKAVIPDQISRTSRISSGLIPENTTVIDLDELIQELKDIAKCLGENKMGFHKINKSERDRSIGKTALRLSKLLVEQYDNPNPNTAINAYNFVKVYELITDLEEIAKQRGSRFGFGSSLLQEDILLSEKAEKNIETLIKNTSKAAIKKTIKFLENYELICDLEKVAGEKLNNSPFGFAKDQNQEDDLELGNKALAYAKAIKLKEDSATINAAIIFLELIKEEDQTIFDEESGKPSIIPEEGGCKFFEDKTACHSE